MKGSQGGRYPFSESEVIDILLSGAVDVVMEKGKYIVYAKTDLYANDTFGGGGQIIEINVGTVAVPNWISLIATGSIAEFYADTGMVRTSNPAGDNRLVGMRVY